MAENNVSEPTIKVLIVDDEQLVRKGLRLTIDWEKHGMTVVDDAPNGSLGWEKFMEHRPQIVITDIVMPEMNGIEFAQKIKKEAPHTKILFLSCHKDFEYAQQGIQIGVSDYIVKTSLDEHELGRCLDNLQKEIAERQNKQNDPIREIPALEQDILHEWLVEKKQTARNQILQRLGMEWKWMIDEGFIYHLYSQSDSIDQPFFAIMQRDPMMLMKGTQDGNFLICPKEALNFCDDELLRSKISNPSLEWRRSGPITSIEQWMSAVQRLHRLRNIELEFELRSESHKEEVLSAIDYIDQNLHFDLRAADIAIKIGVSRSYFSTIFKESTGSSIISFISDRRLERAKVLLQSTAYRTDEIAEKVGISDAKYFSKWFKKSTLLTPGQYRFQTK